jgi:hypothetical protein
MQQLVGAPVKVVARHDFIAQPGDRQQREGNRRRTGRQGQRARAAFDGGDALLEDIGRRVHEARVDVPEFLQRKKIGGVLGALEHVGRGLVDRHGPGAGGGIGNLSGVQRLGAESFGCHAHDVFINSWTEQFDRTRRHR